MMYVLIGPKDWFADISPLSGGLIISPFLNDWLWFKSIYNDFPQFYNSLLHIGFDPGNRFVWFMFWEPSMCSVDFK